MGMKNRMFATCAEVNCSEIDKICNFLHVTIEKG